MPALVAVVFAGALQASSQGTATTLFQDDFEDPGDWERKEEPGPCHVVGTGTSGRDAAAARLGNWGFQVFANEAGFVLPNHAFGAYPVSHATGYVAPLRLEVWATRDPATNGSTQAGPEFGVQVTHEYAPREYRTTTFGFQYVGSPHHPPQWRLWAENETLSDVAEWRPVHTAWLQAGSWYRFELEADLTIPAYRSLVVEGPDWPGPFSVPGVAGFPIAREVKWQENATWVHVDATSLWNNCGLGPPLSVYEARAWYDDVRLDLLSS